MKQNLSLCICIVLLYFVTVAGCTCKEQCIKIKKLGKNHKVLLTSADVRAVQQIQDTKGGLITCTEPSPDVAKAVSESISAAVSAMIKAAPVSLSASRSYAESIAQLTERLATIQLLRDSLYRACEAYANGLLTPIHYSIMLSRYDDLMVTLLMGELAAGAFGRQLAGAGMSADGIAKATSQVTEKKIQTREIALGLKSSLEGLVSTLELAKSKSDQETAKNIGVEIKRVKEFYEEISRIAESTALTAADTSLLQTTGVIIPQQNPRIAEILERIQKNYMEDTSLDTLLISCITVLNQGPDNRTVAADTPNQGPDNRAVAADTPFKTFCSDTFLPMLPGIVNTITRTKLHSLQIDKDEDSCIKTMQESLSNAESLLDYYRNVYCPCCKQQQNTEDNIGNRRCCPN